MVPGSMHMQNMSAAQVILETDVRTRAFNMQAGAAAVCSDVAVTSNSSLAWCACAAAQLKPSHSAYRPYAYSAELMLSCLLCRSTSENEAVRAAAGQLSERVMKAVTLEEGLYHARLS